MKVIHELVSHFWSRGVLSLEDMEYLVAHGFAAENLLPGYERALAEREQALSRTVAEQTAPHPLEAVEEILVERTARRRGGGVLPRGRDLSTAALRQALRDELAQRQTALALVLRWGRLYRDCDTWIDAAVLLRALTPGRLTAGLAALLAQRGMQYDRLWQAVDTEPFHAIVDGQQPARGRVARAFRMLLVSRDTNDLGRYSSILAHDETQQVVNLCRVYRCLLLATRGVYDRHRTLLVKSWRRGMPETAAWALVLLYNARRAKKPAGAELSREYSLCDFQELTNRQAAWSAAMVMDGKAITRLLTRCAQHEHAPPETAAAVPLYCPIEWKMPG